MVELDRYFLEQAGQDAKRKVAAPFVMIDSASRVVGYYTLSAYSLFLSELPQATARRLPKYPVLPATLLGRLAVSREYRGLGLGQELLLDALRRIWRSTSEIASVGVTAHAFDDNARSFYLRLDFMPLTGHTNKLFLSMRTIEKLFI